MATTYGGRPGDLYGLGASEWLEPDGLGGFAMGTIGGPATRRYHGLLCVAITPPTGRVMLVNALGETVTADGVACSLDSHHYPGTTFPDGHTHLVGFEHAPWPTWRFAGGITREVVVPRGSARTIVRWTASRGTLEVRPLLSGRDYHALHRENAVLDGRCHERDGVVEVTPYPGAIPGVRFRHGGRFRAAPDWYRRFVYPAELARGLDGEEDLFCPGVFTFDLAEGPAVLVLEPVTATGPVDVAQALDVERRRRAFILPASRSAPPEVIAPLVRAADAFVVRASRTTVIAGYPWFTDWGRDTFIAARGLGLAFGEPLERELLLAWAAHVSAGMIPNRFPDGGPVELNAADASLWYALRCARHLARAPVGAEARATLAASVRSIIEGYLAGVRHGIQVDDDGLVEASDPGLQLTWMDAKIGDRVVTPRQGKPVELQSLWIGALEAAARVFKTDDAAFAGELTERADWARSTFVSRYWCEARGWLYDVIDGPTRDETLRPNQLYALGLVRPLVDPDRARRALEAVERELLTPVGLRSRARDAAYRGRMEGTVDERDAAYHEGTVWPFLLGIYADACQRVRGKVPPRILDGVLDHLRGPGLGQIAEVFDGDAPPHPRGCPAQAWSVAETLRVALGAIAED